MFRFFFFSPIPTPFPTSPIISLTYLSSSISIFPSFHFFPFYDCISLLCTIGFLHHACIMETIPHQEAILTYKYSPLNHTPNISMTWLLSNCIISTRKSCCHSSCQTNPRQGFLKCSEQNPHKGGRRED